MVQEGNRSQAPEPGYGFTLAFYLNQKGEKEEAVRALKTIVKQHPEHKDAKLLLQEISKNHPGQ